MLCLALALFLLYADATVADAAKKAETAGLNWDSNGDGTPDLNIDVDGDGIADINIDQDGDNQADLNVDVDGDLLSDLNTDIDDDGIPDLNIDSDGDRYPDSNIDSDFDGFADIWFTEGTNATFRLNNKDGLVFATDGNYDEFQGLMVDGVALTDDEFASLEGGTIVQLFAPYLKTLSLGQHTLTFIYPNETVSCYFYVAKDTWFSRSTENVDGFLFGAVIVLGLLMVTTLVIIWKIATKNLYKNY